MLTLSCFHDLQSIETNSQYENLSDLIAARAANRCQCEKHIRAHTDDDVGALIARMLS